MQKIQAYIVGALLMFGSATWAAIYAENVSSVIAIYCRFHHFSPAISTVQHYHNMYGECYSGYAAIWRWSFLCMGPFTRQRA